MQAMAQVLFFPLAMLYEEISSQSLSQVSVQH